MTLLPADRADMAKLAGGEGATATVLDAASARAPGPRSHQSTQAGVRTEHGEAGFHWGAGPAVHRSTLSGLARVIGCISALGQPVLLTRVGWGSAHSTLYLG